MRRFELEENRNAYVELSSPSMFVSCPRTLTLGESARSPDSTGSVAKADRPQVKRYSQ